VTEQYSTRGADTGLLEAFWRYRRSSAVIILAFGLLAYLVATATSGGATARASFGVIDPRSATVLQQGVTSDTAFISYLTQRASFANSATVAAQAATIMKRKTGRPYTGMDVQGAVTAKADPNDGIIIVTAKAADMETAAHLANSVVTAYGQLSQRAIQADLDRLLAGIRKARTQLENEASDKEGASRNALQEALFQLRNRETSATIDVTLLGSTVTFSDDADPTAVMPSTAPRQVVIGLVLGLLVAMVVAFLRATRPDQPAPEAVRSEPADRSTEAAPPRRVPGLDWQQRAPSPAAAGQPSTAPAAATAQPAGDGDNGATDLRRRLLQMRRASSPVAPENGDDPGREQAQFRAR
jgi:capsular polysaccharide biosynthesis protein